MRALELFRKKLLLATVGGVVARMTSSTNLEQYSYIPLDVIQKVTFSENVFLPDGVVKYSKFVHLVNRELVFAEMFSAQTRLTQL